MGIYELPKRGKGMHARYLWANFPWILQNTEKEISTVSRIPARWLLIRHPYFIEWIGRKAIMRSVTNSTYPNKTISRREILFLFEFQSFQKISRRKVLAIRP